MFKECLLSVAIWCLFLIGVGRYLCRAHDIIFQNKKKMRFLNIPTLTMYLFHRIFRLKNDSDI